MNERLFQALSILVLGKAPRKPVNCLFADFSDIEVRLLSHYTAKTFMEKYDSPNLSGAGVGFSSVTGRTTLPDPPLVGCKTKHEAYARLINQAWQRPVGRIAAEATKNFKTEPKVKSLELALHIGERLGLVKVL